MKKYLCPIGRKDPEKRHYHEANSRLFDHEESVGKRAFARVRIAFEAREFEEKGIVVTGPLLITAMSMGTVMPKSYYKEYNIPPISDPERAHKLAKRIEKLLLQSRMQRKMK